MAADANTCTTVCGASEAGRVEWLYL